MSRHTNMHRKGKDKWRITISPRRSVKYFIHIEERRITLKIIFHRGCSYLLLVAVLQLCIEKVQSDGFPKVNDLNKRKKKQRKMETSKFSLRKRTDSLDTGRYEKWVLP